MLIYSYKFGSRSAIELSRSLPALRIKHSGSRLRGNSSKKVINWGASELPEEVSKCTVLNPPQLVRDVSDKISFFNNMPEEIVPPWTTDKDVARGWLGDDATVVCRTLTRASAGRGIVLATEADDLPNAPLYTKYVPKKEEYRVHIFRGEVIDFQRKARSHEVEDDDVNWKIRTHENGFIFMREGVDLPPQVEENSLRAMEASGLDFGAVDILWNRKKELALVLEINSAPGLEGTTLENYTRAINEWRN